MIIDLDKLNAGTWFTLDGGGQVCLRVCGGDDYQAIRSQAVKIKSEVVFDPKTRAAQKIRDEVVDDRLLSGLLWDFSIVDWKDFYDAKGQEIPCTKDMKILLMGKSPKFASMITSCLEKLREVEATEAEESLKN